MRYCTKTLQNPKVDFYFEKASAWHDEIEKLRSIVLTSQLCEELKWGVPCYTLQGSNVVLIHAFKQYCALLFIKGALLQDTAAILIQQTANVQAGRQIRFTNIDEILRLESVIQTYIDEAIAVEKAGRKVEYLQSSALIYPEEFQNKLNIMPALQTAFTHLTPGRQRAYILYFSAPKLSKTRVLRVEKSVDPILYGLGLHD